MKLPITPLLYVVSIASLAGIVQSVIKYTDKSNLWDAKKRNEIKAANAALKKKGVGANSGDQGWNYASETFWRQLRDANFTGKIEVKKTDDSKKKPIVEEVRREVIDLNTVFEVICITSAGDDTGVVVNYTTDVDVPPGLIPKPSVNVVNTMPKGRGRPRPRPVVSVGAPPHHLKVGDKLWKKYDYVVLKSVDLEARFATFELQIPEKKDPKTGEFRVQPMFKPVLGLPPEIQAKMLAIGTGGTNNTGGGTASPVAPNKVPEEVWVDTPETTISREGRVNVAKKDQRFLEENGPDIFNDDVHMRDYSGGRGKHKVRGVQIRKLSTRVRQFGSAKATSSFRSTTCPSREWRTPRRSAAGCTTRVSATSRRRSCGRAASSTGPTTSRSRRGVSVASGLLTLDRGNTTLDGMWHGESPWRQRVDPSDRAAVERLLMAHDLDTVAALTVVASGLVEVEQLLAGRAQLLVAGRDLLCPLPVAYPDPEALGVDRWVGAFAAHRLYGAAVVVDCGTAVTVNLVDGDGTFLGGAIAPGPGSLAGILATVTPALPTVDLAADLTLPALDPAAAVAAGVQLGFCGAVDRLRDELVAASNLDRPTVVVTGGHAEVYLRHGHANAHHHPDLLHRGLRWLVETNDSNS